MVRPALQEEISSIVKEELHPYIRPFGEKSIPLALMEIRAFPSLIRPAASLSPWGMEVSWECRVRPFMPSTAIFSQQLAVVNAQTYGKRFRASIYRMVDLAMPQKTYLNLVQNPPHMMTHDHAASETLKTSPLESNAQAMRTFFAASATVAIFQPRRSSNFVTQRLSRSSFFDA